MKKAMRKSYPTPEKGDVIKLVGGTYAGCKGWIDKSRPETKCYRPVIIAKDGEEVQTSVTKQNVKVVDGDADLLTYPEAVLDQHPDINAALDKVIRDLAECRVSPGGDLTRVINEKLTTAKKNLKKRGSKAKYRDVLYGPEEIVFEHEDD